MLLWELVKGKVSAAAAATAATGYLLVRERPDVGLAWTFVGTFLAAGSASIFNQWQERLSDARMPRTAKRPLPAGRISPSPALALSVLFLVAGLGLLGLSGGLGPVLLAGSAFGVYAGLYAPLKRRTPFASIPGALTGALPPLIGWTTAGGSPVAPSALALATFFFLWQVPHFLFLFRHYEREYRAAGFPVLGDVLSDRQVGRLALVWVSAAACAALAFPLFGLVRRPAGVLTLVVAAALLVGSISQSLLTGKDDPAGALRNFRWVNGFAVVVCLVTGTEGMLG